MGCVGVWEGEVGGCRWGGWEGEGAAVQAGVSGAMLERTVQVLTLPVASETWLKMNASAPTAMNCTVPPLPLSHLADGGARVSKGA